MNTSTPKDGQNIAFAGIIVNILLTIIKALGGIFGNSYALIADAIESATDIIGSSIVYLGVRYAQKPADDNHPYGHGKTEPMAGLAVSILLIFAVLEIVTGAIKRINSPESGVPEFWTLWILVGVISIKGGLFLRAFVIGRNLKSTAVTGDAFHHLSDAITTGVALLGTLLALFAGENFAQAANYAAIVASVFMLYNIYHIGWPAMRELLDESSDPELEGKIRDSILQDAEIKHINVCLVRKSGFDRLVELHLLIDGEMSVREGHRIAHSVETEIKKRFENIRSVVVHIEPDYEVVE
ncbi:cation transporter [Candidatus Gracilibacteria bacterium]|nr:cation transporter [Candidatus Gracilibacteria bacterium]